MLLPAPLFTLSEWFRIHWAGRPLLLCLVLAIVLAIILRIGRGRWRLDRFAAAILTPFCLASLLYFVGLVIWYALTPAVFEFAEPTTTAIGWLYVIGKPIYPAPESMERYAHIWGPATFMAQGWMLRLFGPSLIVAKWLGTTAALGSLVFVYLTCRSVVRAFPALLLTGGFAAVLLIFRNMAFWTRPDPLELLAVSLALFASTRATNVVLAILVGICTGVLFDLKFTGPLYILPALALLICRIGWRSLVLAILVAVLTAAAPFVLANNVSWSNYLAWIRMSAGNGLSLITLRQNVEWAAFFAVPSIVSYLAISTSARPRDKESQWLAVALTMGVGGVAIAASKPGAGIFHLLPFLPILTYQVARHLSVRDSASDLHAAVAPLAISFVLVTSAILLSHQFQFLTAMHHRAQVYGDASDDIRRFLDAHPGERVEFGYGSSAREYESFARPLAVFRTGLYLLDSPAIQEHQLAGLELPDATMAAIQNCSVRYWLLPRDDEPWSQRNQYPVMKQRTLYPEAFRLAFEESYRRVESTAHFDVWQCRR